MHNQSSSSETYQSIIEGWMKGKHPNMHQVTEAMYDLMKPNISIESFCAVRDGLLMEAEKVMARLETKKRRSTSEKSIQIVGKRIRKITNIRDCIANDTGNKFRIVTLLRKEFGIERADVCTKIPPAPAPAVEDLEVSDTD